jgi:WD40 repeat protein
MKDEREHLQLFDLIAREWTLPSPAARVVFNRAGSAVAFDCADGSIQLASLADKASPNSRIRRAADTGRLTIAPRTKPFAPLKAAEFSQGRSSRVALLGAQNFVFAKEDGRINTLTPGGTAVHLRAKAKDRISAVAATPDGETLAFACGPAIHIGPAKGDVEHSLHAPAPVTALGFSPDGRMLAAAHAAGLTRWAVSDLTAAALETGLDGAPEDLVWRDDGAWILCCMGGQGVCVIDARSNVAGTYGDFPAPVHNASFSPLTDTVIASGAFRVAGWSLAETPLPGVTTGKAGLVLIDAVAASPTRNLAAVGYANGLLSLAEIGRREEILLREDTGAGITALAFSPDGNFLAVAGSDGSAALVEFPNGMFKS